MRWRDTTVVLFEVCPKAVTLVLCRVLAATVLLAGQPLLLGVVLDVPADFIAWRAFAAAADKPQEKTRKTPALSQAVYEKLTEAQALAEEGNSGAALRVLNGVRDNRRNKLNSYELANLYNMYAFIRFQQERYQQAIGEYKKVLAQPNLPLAMTTNTHYSLAQLYFVVENYPAAISSLQRWFALAENPQPEAYVLLAQAYYQTRSYNKALQNIERAMSLARAKGKAPQENWYLLQRALYYDKGDYKKVARVLEQLLRRWPKKEYLTQLSGIRGELRDTRGQLVAMETAYQAGMLSTEQEWLNMAYLYLGTDTPYKAAQVWQRGLDQRMIKANARHYQLLGNALRAAQEQDRAIPVLVRAAELAGDGEPWAQLANIYLDIGDYGKAARAARTALGKGKLRRPDQMYVAWGMALYNLDQLDTSRTQFEKAAKDRRSRQLATDWIDFLDGELLRRAALQDGLG